jgi:hypothetical protein
MGGVKLYHEAHQLTVVVFVNSRMLSKSIVISDRRLNRISSMRMGCFPGHWRMKAVDD